MPWAGTFTSEVKNRWIAVAVALSCGALAWGAHHLTANPSADRWPADGASIVPPPLAFPAGFGTHRIYLDAGHGAENNTGNRSSLCRDEQDFTMSLARDLAQQLEQSGHFEVKLSRQPGALVAYRDRVREAEEWHAAAFVSLHSDVRGKAEQWSPRPGLRCSRNRTAPGFSVLWSDEGGDELSGRRLALARSLASHLSRTGLIAYDGSEYRELYGRDEGHAGVFVDRHEPTKRIFVLRQPTMPSVIVETHNAWDDREARRWEQPAIRRAFGVALSGALVTLLSAPR
jgi:N-acetylmuramoyl-L-alanine amidase